MILALLLSILPPGSIEWRQNNTRIGQYEKANCAGRLRCSQFDLRTAVLDFDAGGLLTNIPLCGFGQSVSCDGGICSCTPNAPVCGTGQTVTCDGGACSCITAFVVPVCLAGQAVVCDGGTCTCAPFVQTVTQCNAGQVASCTAGVCSCVTLVGVLPYANGGFGTTLNCASNERVTCNGSACSCSGVTVYGSPTGITGTTPNDTNFQYGGFEVPATATASSIVCSAATAGTTGSDDINIVIRNVTDSTDHCTVTFKCNAFSSTTPSKQTCGGSTTLNTGKVYTFRVGNAPCTTDPAGLQCTLLYSIP